MSLMNDRTVEGYEAPIKRSLWERITSFGAPRVWATLWLMGCLLAAFQAMMLWGMWWAVAVAVGWVLGHVVLVALTLFDAKWDDMAIAQLARKYKAFYDAG